MVVAPHLASRLPRSVPAERVRVIPCGIDLERFRREHADAGADEETPLRLFLDGLDARVLFAHHAERDLHLVFAHCDRGLRARGLVVQAVLPAVLPAKALVGA